jgi:hypothetical protein
MNLILWQTPHLLFQAGATMKLTIEEIPDPRSHRGRCVECGNPPRYLVVLPADSTGETVTPGFGWATSPRPTDTESPGPAERRRQGGDCNHQRNPVVVHWQLPLTVGTFGLKNPASILSGRPTRFRPPLSASPLRSAVGQPRRSFLGCRWVAEEFEDPGIQPGMSPSPPSDLPHRVCSFVLPYRPLTTPSVTSEFPAKNKPLVA